MTRPISRRSAVQLGGLGLASTVVGATGLAQGAGRAFALVGGARFVEPPVLASAGGQLQVRLEAARGAVKVAGRSATVLAYNGGLPGPTLRLQPGDRLQVRLVNRLDAATNLHVHTGGSALNTRELLQRHSALLRVAQKSDEGSSQPRDIAARPRR